MKPLTLSEVLNYWLESIQGTAKHVRPKGYERTGEHADQEAELRARCVCSVERVAATLPWQFRSNLLEQLRVMGDCNHDDVLPSLLQSEIDKNPIYRCHESSRPMRPQVPTFDTKGLAFHLLTKHGVRVSTATLKRMFESSTFNGNVWKDDRGHYVISLLAVDAIKEQVRPRQRFLVAIDTNLV